MKYIARTQSMALMKQFDGKSVTFKSSTLVGMARGVGTKWEMFKTGASSVKAGASTGKAIYSNAKKIKSGVDLVQKGGRAAAHGAATADLKGSIVDLCKHLCPGKNPNEIFAALGLPSVEKFAAELAPFVGAISSGKDAIVAWIRVIRTQWARGDTASRRFAFAPENPEAAFDAVLVLLDRELNSGLARAGVKTGAFTGKTLGAFADAGAITGPVIGCLEILAEIIQTIIEYVRDVNEVEQANQLLDVGALNLDLFGVCPILGCYFLVVQDHSTIINFAVGDYGTPNFVFDAERLVKKIDPVLSRAREYIRASRFEIREFAGAKGVVGEHWSMKGPLSHVRQGQVRPVGAELRDRTDAIGDAVTDRIREWRGKPVRPPGFDKSRIHGFGSNGKGGFGTK